MRSVGVARAAGDGGAAPAVGVGGLLRRAVAVVGAAALVAGHLVRAQRRIADVPVGRLPLRHGPPQGRLAAAQPRRELVLLVAPHRALPQRPVARRRRPQRPEVRRRGRRAAEHAQGRQGHERGGAESSHGRRRWMLAWLPDYCSRSLVGLICCI